MTAVNTLSEEELRAKYAQPRNVLEEQLGNEMPPAKPASAADYDKLADVKICQACDAQGVVKVQYGYRVMDQVCEQCDGEGCIIRGGAKNTVEETATGGVIASEETAEKVRQIEQMIEETGDLDELERLEAALRSGKLDDVLQSRE